MFYFQTTSHLSFIYLKKDDFDSVNQRLMKDHLIPYYKCFCNINCYKLRLYHHQSDEVKIVRLPYLCKLFFKLCNSCCSCYSTQDLLSRFGLATQMKCLSCHLTFQRFLSKRFISSVYDTDVKPGMLKQVFTVQSDVHRHTSLIYV